MHCTIATRIMAVAVFVSPFCATIKKVQCAIVSAMGRKRERNRGRERERNVENETRMNGKKTKLKWKIVQLSFENRLNVRKVKWFELIEFIYVNCTRFFQSSFVRPITLENV